MKFNTITIAGVGVGLLGAVLLAMFVVSSGSAAEETVPAYMVVEDLEPGMSGEEITARVEADDIPERTAPAERVTDLDGLGDKEVIRTVGQGEVLTAHQLAEPGPLAGGVVVPAGYEAITLEAEPAPGVEGYVTPGSRVNVYATLAEGGAPPPPEGEAGGSYTQLVLGHVDVLAVSRGNHAGGSQEEGGADGRIVLMLQVRPEDAPVLVHAQRQGELWFSLVNPDDPAPSADRVTTGHFEPGRRTSEINEARSQQDSDDQTQEDQQ